MSKQNKKQNFSRREALKKIGGTWVTAGSLFLLNNSLSSCSNKITAETTSGNSTTDGNTGSTACGVIPSETAGPYPAHDDSAINCLRLSGIVRSNIKTSLGTGGYSGTATATGLPLTIQLNLVNTNTSCATGLSGYAIYLWHCTSSGLYSMYSSGVTSETYLRGVQQTDSNGSVTFQTIYPGCYSGRMPHVHFEIYPSLGQAVDDSYITRTSQFGFPTSVSSTVYNNVSGYSASVSNFNSISYSTDNVFSDGTTYQIATLTGNTTSGYTATLNVGIAA